MNDLSHIDARRAFASALNASRSAPSRPRASLRSFSEAAELREKSCAWLGAIIALLVGGGFWTLVVSALLHLHW